MCMLYEAYGCVYLHMLLFLYVHACVCVCACVHAFMCMSVHVHAKLSCHRLRSLPTEGAKEAHSKLINVSWLLSNMGSLVAIVTNPQIMFNRKGVQIWNK